jgi:hypothetical protein
MRNMTREEREQHLVGLMLMGRSTIHAAYTLVVNRHPSPEMTDRAMIAAVLAIEYPPNTAMGTLYAVNREAFAVQYYEESGPDLQPAPISLSDWMTKWLPGLERDERRVAVFPTTDNQGVVVDPAAMSGCLQASLGSIEDPEE